jgi:AcrR family transcriptional regulator
MIARAACEIGLEQVTMKAVADRLGVSVPGLYHHVQGRDDLMRLGAEYSAAQLHVPVDRDQHWAAWLLEWARYSHDAFVAQPALLGQFLNGSLGVDRMVTHVNAVIGVLSRHGFTPIEAVEAYEIVSDCALGSAVGEIRQVEAARSGRPVAAEYLRVLATEPPDALPHLRSLVAAKTDVSTDFTGRIITVLAGIALRRGEPWEPILDLADDPGRAVDIQALHA